MNPMDTITIPAAPARSLAEYGAQDIYTDAPECQLAVYLMRQAVSDLAAQLRRMEQR